MSIAVSGSMSRTRLAKERLPFQLQFFHPGFVQSGTVQVSRGERRQG